jgi:hypothetical protein
MLVSRDILFWVIRRVRKHARKEEAQYPVAAPDFDADAHCLKKVGI